MQQTEARINNDEEQDADNNHNGMEHPAAASTSSTLQLQMSTGPSIAEPIHEQSASTLRVATRMDHYFSATKDQQVPRQDPQVHWA